MSATPIEPQFPPVTKTDNLVKSRSNSSCTSEEDSCDEKRRHDKFKTERGKIQCNEFPSYVNDRRIYEHCSSRHRLTKKLKSKTKKSVDPSKIVNTASNVKYRNTSHTNEFHKDKETNQNVLKDKKSDEHFPILSSRLMSTNVDCTSNLEPKSKVPLESSKNEMIVYQPSQMTRTKDELSRIPSATDQIGPSLPPELAKVKDGKQACIAKNPLPNDEIYGPVLPPNFKQTVASQARSVFGPSLPPGFKLPSTAYAVPGNMKVDEEDMVGPLPQGYQHGDEKTRQVQEQLELRAQLIRRKFVTEDGKEADLGNRRESWMLELPPERALNMGLGPRSFRMREAPDMSDRSDWTNTPADKIKKNEQAMEDTVDPEKSKEEMRIALLAQRDRSMEELSKKSSSSKKNRTESLVEMHHKKQKKKKKKEENERRGKKPERRPFDRDVDLQTNRFDEAQHKAVLKKAQLLDTRFSQGESKFL